MAIFPWRFQSDIPKGTTDPEVTVFYGPERAVLDDNGEPTGATFVEQATNDPVIMPLSVLVADLASADKMERHRKNAHAKR